MCTNVIGFMVGVVIVVSEDAEHLDPGDTSTSIARGTIGRGSVSRFRAKALHALGSCYSSKDAWAA